MGKLLNMGVFLLVIFVVLPLAEIAVLIQVGRLVGVLPAILSLLFLSVAGALIAKREGTAVWRRLQESLARGEAPTGEIADGFLVLLGGALLLTPGFLTDALGLIMVFPLSRAAVKRALSKGTGWFVIQRFPLLGPLWRSPSAHRAKAKVVRVESENTSSDPSATSVERS